MPPRFRLSPRRIFFSAKTPARDWPELVTLGDIASRDLNAMTLVLDAVGIEYSYDKQTGTLSVATSDAEQAQQHWLAYCQENEAWPPPLARPASPPGSPPTLGMIALLTIFFFHTGSWHTTNLWFERGAVNAEAILTQGQWWRLVTALTLHADLVHLAGNCLIGGLVIHLLCKVLGYGSGWLLLLLAGAGGNLLNVALREGQHFSVGLSTSVFAAIGILTGLQIVRFRTRSLQYLLPLGAGAGLLAVFGSEGIRTDLGAHLFGFLVGIGCGTLCGLTDMVAKAAPHARQVFLLALTMALVLLCWMLALR